MLLPGDGGHGQTGEPLRHIGPAEKNRLLSGSPVPEHDVHFWISRMERLDYVHGEVPVLDNRAVYLRDRQANAFFGNFSRLYLHGLKIAVESKNPQASTACGLTTWEDVFRRF